MLAKHKKGIFLSKRAYFGESQQLVRLLSNQISSFRLEAHQIFFDLLATVVLHYRIYGFSRKELLVWNSFESHVFDLRAAMKTQSFANIWRL